MIQGNVILRSCILNYLGIKCQNVDKFISNASKTKIMCVCVYMCIFVCIYVSVYTINVYIYLFRERERRKQMWEMVNGERNMVFIVLFFKLFFLDISQRPVRVCVLCVCVCYVERGDSKDVSKCPLQIFLCVTTKYSNLIYSFFKFILLLRALQMSHYFLPFECFHFCLF